LRGLRGVGKRGIEWLVLFYFYFYFFTIHQRVVWLLERRGCMGMVSRHTTHPLGMWMTRGTGESCSLLYLPFFKGYFPRWLLELQWGGGGLGSCQVNLPLWFYIYEELIHTIVFTPSLTVNFRTVIYNSQQGEVAFFILQNCRGLSVGQTSLNGGSKCVSQRVASREGRRTTGTSPLRASLAARRATSLLFSLNFHFRRHIPGVRKREG